MNKTYNMALLAFSLAVVHPLSAFADAGLVAKGEELFASNCAECHSAKEGKNKKGPSLYDVIGRQSGSVAGYAYSDALRSSGIVWTAPLVSDYVTNPRKVVPGGKMKYDGMPDANERAALLAYLGSLKR